MTLSTLAHSGLNRAHVPHQSELGDNLSAHRILPGRADVRGSKSNVAMHAWLPQASYPSGNFYRICQAREESSIGFQKRNNRHPLELKHNYKSVSI